MDPIIYNTIGNNYNTTRQADPYILNKLIELLDPQPDNIYLDLGCGTGNYTIGLTNKGITIYGVDPSEKMLGEAGNRNKSIQWLHGSAEQIPAVDQSFDGIVATLTLHHWTNIAEAFKEIYRVLKPGGKIIFFTSTPEQMRGYWLNKYFPQMLTSSVLQMPAYETIENHAAEAGLKITKTEKYFVQDDLKDHFLYVGKNNPAFYFNENIRQGISSFSALANVKEVIEGLVKLKADIDSGGFEVIKGQYENEDGDYLFIRLDKI